MIHGHKKSQKKKLQSQQKQQSQLADKISIKLQQFFKIRNQQPQQTKLQILFQFTSILMQLCPDIITIYNYRRQLINKMLTNLDTTHQQKIFNKQIKLNNKIIRTVPKSYTLWSYRQWLIISLYSINSNIINQQKQLCTLLLNKDQKNFHVWNYRNWINTISMNVDIQLTFTKTKINTNPFNFSAYHFRSKYLIWKYKHQILNSPPQQQQQIIIYGMPKQVFDAELQTVRTAIYLNPKQQAPWTYYNWILKQLAPILLLDIKPLNQNTQNDQHLTYEILFSHNVQNFKQLVTIEGNKQFQLFSKSCPSTKWQIRLKQPIFSKQIKINSISSQHFLKYLTNLNIITKQKQTIRDTIKKIYQNEQKFIKQVLQSQQNICHFCCLQFLQIYKLYLYLGTTSNQWKQISIKALQIFNLSKLQSKNQKYFSKMKIQWERINKSQNLSEIQQKLKTWK